MIVQPDFLDHWKTRLLVTITGEPTAPQMVIRLWSHCQQRRTSRFANLSDCALAAICQTTLKPDAWQDALIEAGFVKKKGDLVIVHDWDVVNASLIANWKNGKKGGRPTHQKPMDNPRVSQREPTPLSYLSTLSYPLDADEAFKQLFEKWVRFRIGLGRKPKDWSALFQEQLDWLARAPKAQRAEIISQSIRNGWQGLFESKGDRNGSTMKPQLTARPGYIRDKSGKEWKDMSSPVWNK